MIKSKVVINCILHGDPMVLSDTDTDIQRDPVNSPELLVHEHFVCHGGCKVEVVTVISHTPELVRIFEVVPPRPGAASDQC